MDSSDQRRHLSVSSIKLADKCSLAHHYRYVDQIPAPEETAAKLFGTVIHNGLELWYGDVGSENHRITELPKHVHDQWFQALPLEIAIALRHCIQAEGDCADLVQLIMLKRPSLKQPRTCKDFEISPQKARFEDCRDTLLNAQTACETMRWPKDENAFQAYQKSMFIAQTLESRWKHLPRPLVVEREFTIVFAGIEIRGRIDQIRCDPSPEGEVQIEGLDVKTGRRLMTQMDAFLQWFLYNEACIQLPDLPVPDYWTYWMARWNRPQHGRIDRERHGALAKRVLDRVRKQIESNDYAPHYGMWCDSCDYRGLCEQEISVWPVGEDSLTLEIGA